MSFKIKSSHLIFFFTVLNFYTGMGQNLKRFTYSAPTMGTVMHIVFYASDSLKANKTSKAVFRKVKTLNNIFSDYDSNSELVQLCNTYKVNNWIKVSDELFDILQQSKTISQLTKGAFDITVGPYTKLWRRAKKENKLPSKQKIFEVKKSIGYQNISLNTKNKTVKFLLPDMQLDLGGIAKGYTADKVLKLLKSYNIKHALIDLGGDITVSNSPPNKKGWDIEVSYFNHKGKHVSEILSLNNIAVATSGDYYQKILVAGNTYSHIINPSTGLGITKPVQVTVLAPSGSIADSFASAFSIMSRANIEKLLTKHVNTHVLIITLDDISTNIWRSKLFNNFKTGIKY